MDDMPGTAKLLPHLPSPLVGVLAVVVHRCRAQGSSSSEPAGDLHDCIDNELDTA